MISAGVYLGAVLLLLAMVMGVIFCICGHHKAYLATFWMPPAAFGLMFTFEEAATRALGYGGVAVLLAIVMVSALHLVLGVRLANSWTLDQGARKWLLLAAAVARTPFFCILVLDRSAWGEVNRGRAQRVLIPFPS